MKIRKELWFGLTFMGLVVAGQAAMLLGAEEITSGHLGMLMLSMVVVAIRTLSVTYYGSISKADAFV